MPAPSPWAGGRALPDCVVVGAGAFGSWTALRLREAGRSVVLVDAFGAGNSKSSSGSASRVIRLGYGPEEIYTRWAMRSLVAWQQILTRGHRPELFQRTGMLWTAHPGHPHAEGTLAVFRKLRVPHESLSSQEIAKRYPDLRFHHDVIGIFEPDSGALLASQAVRTVTAEAERSGVEVIATRIAPPAEEGRLEYLVTEDGRKLAADTFVFACGPWMPKLFPIAVGGRIRVTRQLLFYFDAPSVRMPIWIDFSDPRGPYTIPPLAGKGFKLGLDQHGPEFDPDTGSREVTPAETAAVREVLAERFPALARASLLESEVCQYEGTSTGDFLIDRHPGVPNVWLVGGGSGHGFKHGPAVGEYVAARLACGLSEPRFSWSSKAIARARTVY
jgi:sarcosine oxidase